MNGLKLVCISGITRGLGRALALKMNARGWRMEGCGRDMASLQSLRAELPGSAVLVMAFNSGIMHTVMLRNSFGSSAGSFLGPDAGARYAEKNFSEWRASPNSHSLNVPA